MSEKDTYPYYLKIGNAIIYAGITKDPRRREQEHQRERPHARTRLAIAGNKTTRKAAQEWEKREAARGIPTEHQSALESIGLSR